MKRPPLSRQVVVVTGGASGLGRTAVEAFLARGARVATGDLDQSGLDSLQEEAARRGWGERLVTLRTDVTKYEDAQALAKAAVDRFGRLDTWLNNAGIALYAMVDRTEPDEFERVLRVNVLGQFHGVKAALPYMERQRSGGFINISSIAGRMGSPLLTAYSASKYAVFGMSEALRREVWRKGISVTTICPPGIKTPIFDHAVSKEGVKPKGVMSVEPEVVVREILRCAEKPKRVSMVTFPNWAGATANMLLPWLMDWFMGRFGARIQLTKVPAKDR